MSRESGHSIPGEGGPVRGLPTSFPLGVGGEQSPSGSSTMQLFPALDAAIEAALTASIKRFGVLVPIVKDQHGRILDGHHRQRIADGLGVKYRVDVIRVADDEEAAAIVETLNTDRGHRLKSDMRREVVADLREQGHSLRAIAGAVGVDERTIRRDLSGAAGAAPETTVGLDGKRYPAKRPVVVAAKNEREASRAQDALSVIESLPSVPVIDVRRVERIAREQQADKRRQQPTEPRTIGDGVDIRHGAYWDVLTDVADGSVDAIITDPPYGTSVNAARSVFMLAERTLKPDANLVMLIGQSDIPEYLEALTDRRGWPDGCCMLSFRWLCAWMTPGAATRMHSVKVGTNWKPILVVQRIGDVEDTGPTTRWLLGDVFQSPADDKEHHPWGQNETGFRQLVNAFTGPGDLVLDPFLGGGTTAVVCRDLGRRFIGCDTDAAAIAESRKRLA